MTKHTTILTSLLAMVPSAGADYIYDHNSGFTIYAGNSYTMGPVWSAAVGATETIHFDELPEYSIVTDQYLGFGVDFVSSSIDQTYASDGVFPLDGWGLDGNGDVTLQFDVPIRAVAADLPGDEMRARFYLGDTLLVDTGLWASDDADLGFVGFVTDFEFDRVKLTNSVSNLVIDDLRFQQVVPAPGVLAVLGLGGAFGRRRRPRR